MKKILLILIGTACFYISQAQQLHHTRRTVVFNSTADWCPPCGEWGWAINDSLYKRWKADTSYRAYHISLHSESDQSFLNSSIAELIEGIAQPAPINQFPSFMVDNQDMVDIVDWIDFNFLFNNTDTVDRALDSLAKFIAVETAAPAVAAVGLTAWQTLTDSLYVKTKVRFLQNAAGDYRLAVYVVEDSVMGTQNAQAGLVPHHMVLREPLETNAWGYSLPGPFIPNQEFNYTFKMTIPPSWNKSRLYYMVIVYKVDIQNITAEVENVYMTNQLLTTTNPTSVASQNTELKLRLYPNPARDHITLALPVTGNCSVWLTDMAGKKVAELYDGSMVADEGRVLSLPQSLPAGNYILKAATAKGTYSKMLDIE